MRRPIIATAVLLGALAFAGQAGAADYELNLWGASAQFQLYNQSAINFLTNAPNNCAAAPAQLIAGNFGITKGTGCGGAAQGAGPDTITLRVSSKASYDGVLALQGQAKTEDKSLANSSNNYNFCDPATFGVVAAVPANTCLSGQAGDHCDYHYRVMYNDTTGKYACKRVHLALSDVDPASITESSPLRSFGSAGITYPGSFVHYNPLVVPFGFYTNTDVLVSKCSGGVNDGQQCSAAADCSGGSCGAAAKLDNLSKIQALLIFSRQAVNWTDFGQGYAASPATGIVTCVREAGSGTHATLDYAVFKSNGRPVDPNAVLPVATLGDANIIFNDGTSAEMACVNTHPGAIGYADADQAMSMDPLATALGKPVTLASTFALKYQGVVPSRRAIRNGEYDNFWSIEWVLEDPNNPDYAAGTSKRTLITGGTGLMDQVSSPTSISATDRKDFWASMCEMNYMKLDPLTSQPSYKYYPEYVGASCTTQQLP